MQTQRSLFRLAFATMANTTMDANPLVIDMSTMVIPADTLDIHTAKQCAWRYKTC